MCALSLHMFPELDEGHLWTNNRLSTGTKIGGSRGSVRWHSASMPWTYILSCADGSFYVGSARDLDSRLAQHHEGHAGAYTAKRRPIQLAWATEFTHIEDAWTAERRIHGWSRAKKQALIDGRVSDLGLLSRNYTQFGKPVLGEQADDP